MPILGGAERTTKKNNLAMINIHAGYATDDVEEAGISLRIVFNLELLTMI